MGKVLVPVVMVLTAWQLIAMHLATLTSTASCFLLKREETVTQMNTEGSASVAFIVWITFVLVEMLLQLVPLVLLQQLLLLLRQKHVLPLVLCVMITMVPLRPAVPQVLVMLWISAVDIQNLNVANVHIYN